MNQSQTKPVVHVPCPDCGELSPEAPDRVAKNEVIPCSLCGGLIDLCADECKEAVQQAKATAR
jgi:hypothetical protein